MTTTDDDPRVEALLREAPVRQAEPLTRRDRVAETGFALALVAVIAVLGVTASAPTSSTVTLAIALGLLQAVARRVLFRMGDCTAGPTLVAVGPMLLLLHPALA